MRKNIRLIAAVALSLPVIAVSWFAWSRPDEFSQLFLRSGGRIVQKMADRPGHVAAVLAVSVITLWTVIAVRCAWEAWREDRNAPPDQPHSVANG